MLKLVDATPKEEDEVYQTALKKIAKADKYILITEIDNKLNINYYNITAQEIVFALEYFKMQELQEE